MTIHQWLKDSRLPEATRLLLALEVLGPSVIGGELRQLDTVASDLAQDILNVLTHRDLTEDERAAAATSMFQNFKNRGKA